ncbi:hypothetical protein TrVE_jg9390, partial [Triparma verrucosa]
MGDTTSKVVGFSLLPFYIVVPIWRLWICAYSVKSSLESGDNYKASLDEVRRKAVEDKTKKVAEGEERYKQVLGRLIESGTVKGDEIWLAVVLNVVGVAAIVALIVAIGPDRLLRGASKAYRSWRLTRAARGGVDAISKMSQDDVMLIGSDDYVQFSDVVKIALVDKMKVAPVWVTEELFTDFFSEAVKERFLRKMNFVPNSVTEEIFNGFTVKTKIEICLKFPSETRFQHFTEKERALGNDEFRLMVKFFIGNPEATTEAFGHISTFNTSKVTNMKDLFDVSDFKSDVTKMDLSENARIFNEDIAAWNVGKVEDFTNIFKGLDEFNSENIIKSWNTKWRGIKFTSESLRKSVQEEFTEDKLLTLIMYGSLNTWDVSKVTDMGGLFKGMENFDEDISSWDVKKVQDFSGIFEGATKFNKSKIRNWRPFDLAKRRTKYNNETLRTVL